MVLPEIMRYLCLVLIFSALKVSFGRRDTASGISGFMCTWYYYDLDPQFIKCTWDIAHEYRNKSQFKLKLEWSVSRFNGIHPCASLSLDACKWTQESWPVLDFDDTMFVNISIIDLKDNKRIEQQQHTIDLKSKVKLEPVNQLTASLYNGNCIKVSWSHPIAWKGRVFRIRTKHQDGEEVKELRVKADNELADGPSSHMFSICGLLYYTNYTVSVECKPVIDGYWSDAKELYIRTGKTAPSSPPYLPRGSFTFSEMSNQGYRNVTVYWHRLNIGLWNGAVHQYHVIINSIPACSISTHRVIERITVPEVTFGVENDCGYVIQIRAQNEVNYSLKAAVLNLERRPNLPKLPRDILVEETDTGLLQNISWSYNHHQENTTYTIVWCRKVLDGACKNGIQYTYKHHQIARDSSDTSKLRFQTSVNLPNFPKTAYRFGVSANIGSKYSGFKWSECYHEHMLNPPSISFVGNPDNESVMVLWEHSSCNMNYVSLGYSFIYHILLCRSKVCVEPSERVYGIEQNQMKIFEIAFGRTICVKVFVSYRGDSGPLSAITCYTQRPKYKIKDHKILIAAIVVLAIGTSIFLMAGVCGLHKLRRNYNTKIPVEIPLINTNASESSKSS